MAVTPVPPEPTWRRRLRHALIAVAALAAIVAALGFLVVPPLAKSKLIALANSELGRRATIDKVAFNPFTLHAKLSGFTLADRVPSRTLLRFSTLDVDMSISSLWHLAPVLDAVRLVQPQVELARSADGRWNVQDLIDRALAPSTGPTPAFAIANIEVDDGSVSIDDEVKQHKSSITGIGIGIPFLSSFPREAKILVTPRLEGVVDGARFSLTGSSTSPFADREEATLDLDFDALRLPEYAEYATLPRGLKLAGGALTTRLKLAFVTDKGSPSTVTLAGSARIDDFALRRGDGSPLVSAKTIEAAVGSIDVLARTIALDRVSVEAPQIDLRRSADGSLEFGRLFAGGAAAAPRSASRAAS
ncbi:MAG: DUF748 domain-containing protein, partial [Candidatus Levyibacteriota bacterium]